MLPSHVQVSIWPDTAQEDRYIVFVGEGSTVIAAASTTEPISVQVDNRGPHAIWLTTTPAETQPGDVYVPTAGTWSGQVIGRLFAITGEPADDQ